MNIRMFTAPEKLCDLLSFDKISANPNIIEITTNIRDDQKQVIISIKDNGLGMHKTHKKIWQSFVKKCKY